MQMYACLLGDVDVTCNYGRCRIVLLCIHSKRHLRSSSEAADAGVALVVQGVGSAHEQQGGFCGAVKFSKQQKCSVVILNCEFKTEKLPCDVIGC